MLLLNLQSLFISVVAGVSQLLLVKKQTTNHFCNYLNYH